MRYLVPYILLLPLAGAFINGVAGWRLPRRLVETIACASVGISFILSVFVFMNMTGPFSLTLGDWLTSGWFSAPIQLHVDALSITMTAMVTGVSFLIHVYSAAYMRDDPGYARYFMLLNLFVFSMLLLVLAGNLPLMFVGWEGVGFCSYALIGFWYTNPDNATAGRKAFIVTRLGDTAFGVALVWLFYFSGSTDIAFINSAAASMPAGTATFIGLLLLAGATGKSAQLPLTVWLPDAMAGPTPVSALIHAATMVTAGVYLLMRLFPVISVSETALMATAAVGAVTAFYAATAALAQRDIKKVLAYSTISQIGYMVLAVGAGTVPGALFHLLVHAFFKALLFLAAGCIIKALDEEHDIFKMGGLYGKMPLVFWCFLAGSLALAAAPGTGGFFSKDEILGTVFMRGSGFYYFLWALGELTALITTVYIFRVIFLVFFGRATANPRKTPAVMSWALVPLAFLSLFGGLINLPAGIGGAERLLKFLLSLGTAVGQPVAPAGWGFMAITSGVFAAGFIISYCLYSAYPSWRESLAVKYSGIVDFFFNAWYLDRLYMKTFVYGYRKAADFLFRRVDEGSIDDFFDMTGEKIASFGSILRGTVTGRASTYITAVCIGAAIIVVFFALRYA